MENKKDQLCWECKNACGGCEWSANLEPVPGWTAEKVPRREYIGTKRKQTQGLFIQNHRVPEV